MFVKVKYLGKSMITIQGKEVSIRQHKLAILLLFLLYHETVERDALVAMFWPEKDVNQGRASLRNGLYQLRRNLGCDLFQSSTRDRIALSRDVELEKDVDLLVDRDRPVDLKDQGSFIFMENQELADSEPYESWLFSTRQAYEGIVASVLRSKMEEARRLGEMEEVLRRGLQYLSLRSYDEEVLRQILRCYANMRRYNDAFALYKNFEEVLKKDLGEAPEEGTVALVAAIASEKQQDQNITGKTFKRREIQSQLAAAVDAFTKGKGKHLILYGYPGTGRGHLLREYCQTRSIPFSFVNLESVDATGQEEAFLRYQMKHQKELLPAAQEEGFSLRMIHSGEYLDEASLRRISHWTELQQNNLLLVICVSRHHPDLAERLSAMGGFHLLPIPLLTEVESLEYAKSVSSKLLQTHNSRELYEESKGNFLFLSEDPTMVQKRAVYFKRCLTDLSPVEEKLLASLSIFPKGLPLNLMEYFDEPKRDLAILSNLAHRGYLRQKGGEIAFMYPAFGRFLYEQMPEFSRRLAHTRAAELSAQTMETDTMAKFKAHHYKKAAMQPQEYHYELLYLEEKLNFFDEMYPTIVGEIKESNSYTRDRYRHHRALDALQEEIESGLVAPESMNRLLLVQSDYLKSRALISGGRREEGKPFLDRLLDNSRQCQDPLWYFKALVEKIHYAIQKEDDGLMEEAMIAMRELEPQKSFGNAYGAEYLRLKGFYLFTTGDVSGAINYYEEAEALLAQPWLQQSCFLNLAGVSNYKAQALEVAGRSKEAIASSQKAIELVQGRVHKCLDVLYSDYGQMLYRLGDKAKAQEVLEKAILTYNYLGTYWKRPTTEVVLGRLALERGDIRLCQNHLVSAQIYHRADHRHQEEVLLAELSQLLMAETKES